MHPVLVRRMHFFCFHLGNHELTKTQLGYLLGYRLQKTKFHKNKKTGTVDFQRLQTWSKMS